MRLLVTGATGLVGSHVVERALGQHIPVRALVRPSSDMTLLKQWDVECIEGTLDNLESLQVATTGITHIVHCAAKVGDWGPVEEYRTANVDGLRNLLEATDRSSLQQFVQISSLGVYAAKDHYGTDESSPVNKEGIDGYTLTKVESEELLQTYIKEHDFPAIILRPGFIYGPRDRTVMPKLLERLRSGKFAFLGSGEQLLNNIYVGNLVDAIFLALEWSDLCGEAFNLTDERLVTRHEFIESICMNADIPIPKKHVPLAVARGLASFLESTYRLLGKKNAPLLSQARIKFLGLNLDFSIDKARHHLHYAPRIDFQDGISKSLQSLSAPSDHVV